MRIIDADAVWDWYIKEFSEERLGDRAIKPNECRFSMYDIVGNLDNIPEIDIEQYAKEHRLFICTKDILEQIRTEIEQLENPCSKEHGCIAEVLQTIDKCTGRKESE